MAAGPTDHHWTLHELLTYKVVKRRSTTVMNVSKKFQNYVVKELIA